MYTTITQSLNKAYLYGKPSFNKFVLEDKEKEKKMFSKTRNYVIFLIPINFFVSIFLTLGISFRYNYLSNQNSLTD